jgi:hypothetical protein
MKGMLGNMKRRISGANQGEGGAIVNGGGIQASGETVPRADGNLPRRERRCFSVFYNLFRVLIFEFVL